MPAGRAGRRGAWSSLIYVSITIAGLCATLLGAILSTAIGAEGLTGWAWRILFIVAGLGSVLAVVLVSRLHETEVWVVPTSIRTIGVGFSYAIATAIFGGTVPALQAWIGGNWGPQNFGLYVTLAAAISLVVTLTIPEGLRG